MDKILRIDVGAQGGPKATVTPLGEYAGMGGRGMTAMVVGNEVPADCHPLGLENKLVIAPGLMAGSAASTSGRISVGCKSPLTGGIKEANAGGNPAQDLMKLGYRAIVVGNADPALKEDLVTESTARGVSERIYFAEQMYAAGVLEGLRHFGFVE